MGELDPHGTDRLIDFLDKKVDNVRDSVKADIRSLSDKFEAYLHQPNICNAKFESAFVTKRQYKTSIYIIGAGFLVVFALMVEFHGAKEVAAAIPKTLVDAMK